MDKAEVIVPQMDKFKVGNRIPKQIYNTDEIGVRFKPEGCEIIRLKKKAITSRIDSNIKQKNIFEKTIRRGVTGDVSNPSNVPDSFSLTNSLAITNISEKKRIIHICMIKISKGIDEPPELRLNALEKMITEMNVNSNIEKKS